MKKKLLYSMVLAACAFAACSAPKQEKTVTVAEQLQVRLDSLQKKGYMCGHEDATMYGVTWEWDADKCDIFATVGDYPAVMGFDLGGIEMGDAKNLDSVPFTRIHDEVVKHYLNGGIVTISWHPRNPLTGGNAWDVKDLSLIHI